MDKFPVSKEHKGKTYTATATIEGKLLTVTCPTLGKKTTQISSNNEVLAKMLLSEMISENER